MSALKSKILQAMGGDHPQDNQYFFKMFRFMKPYRIRYALSQLLYSAQGFAMPFVFSVFIGNIMAAIVSGHREAMVTAGVQLALMLGGFILVFLVGVYANILIVERASMDMKQQLFRTFVRTGLEDAVHSGEGIAAINTDADTALNVFQGPLMMFLMGVITIVGSTIVIFAADWRLGLATFVVGIISFFMQNRFTKPLARVGKAQLEANAEALKSASNVFSGAIAIRAYNMQPHAFVTFDRENNRLRVL
ncbi:MAG: ABC transporter transmembrane domain-containing protein, partial [Defluviitaleaceae bacterium]|nr:ABC transporter transmembrane domain-containing protein [Defluviitaleaceae bacterium]